MESVWHEDEDVISGEGGEKKKKRCSMKFGTGWLDKSALPGSRLCSAPKLNTCHAAATSLLSRFPTACTAAAQTHEEFACCRSFHVLLRTGSSYPSIPSRSVRQRGAALRPGHERVRKTEEEKGSSAEEMRINGCQSPCGIGGQWSIKAAFSTTDKAK